MITPAELEQYRPSLRRIAGSMIGQADAEDIAQEAIIRAWQARATLRDPTRAGQWIRRICANVCRDRQKRADFRPEDLSSDAPESPDKLLEYADPGDGPLDLLLRRELAEIVARAVDRLPASRRSVARMAIVEGLAWDEIAARLELNPVTVRTRIYRARADLAIRLRAYVEG